MARAGATLWLTRVDQVDAATLASYRAWLGAGEAARCGRFARRARQQQFLIGRGMLRQALGQLLDVAPGSIRLDERPGLAPLLVNAGAKHGAPGFSISHSGAWVACAVSAQAALGLDIEQRDTTRDVLALAEVAFDAGAVAALAALAPAARVDDFYRRWSAREARIKLGDCAGAAARCVALAHADLSIVVCSARALALTLHASPLKRLAADGFAHQLAVRAIAAP